MIKILILIFSINVFCTEIPLIKVINEGENNKIYPIFLNLDNDGQILSLKSGSQQFDFNAIIEGLVLFKIEDKDVLYLECHSCDSLYGGNLMIRYLENGVFEKYKEIYFEFSKRNEKWGLYNKQDGFLIKTLTLKANKLLGKVIGIKEIIAKKYY